MEFIVNIEGQTIKIPKELGEDDGKIKALLAPLFPGAANSKITRTVEGEETIINVVKMAGTKGLLPTAQDVVDLERVHMLLDKLGETPAGENAAVALSREVKDIDSIFANLDPEGILEMDNRIEAAMIEGKSEIDAINAAYKGLCQAEAVPMLEMVTGF